MKLMKKSIIIILSILLMISVMTPVFAKAEKADFSLYTAVKSATIKPQKVAGLKATYITYKSFTLKWNKQNGNYKYQIQKYVSSKKSWINVASGIKENSYNYKNAVGATTYVFRVRAYTSSKNIGSFSNNLTIFTKPKNVTGLKESSVTDNGFKLSWDKVSGATGYLIYKYDKKKNLWSNIAVSANNYYYVTGESLSSNSKFRVRAYKKNGNINTYGGYSSAIETAVKPKKISGLKTVSSKENNVKISWIKQSGAKNYQIYLYDSVSKKFVLYNETTAYSCTLKNMPYLANCRVKVRATSIYKTTTLYGSFSDELSFSLKTSSGEVTQSIEVYCNTGTKTYHFSRDCKSLNNVSDEKLRIVFIADRLDVFEIKSAGYKPCKYCAVS